MCHMDFHFSKSLKQAAFMKAYVMWLLIHKHNNTHLMASHKYNLKWIMHIRFFFVTKIVCVTFLCMFLILMLLLLLPPVLLVVINVGIVGDIIYFCYCFHYCLLFTTIQPILKGAWMKERMLKKWEKKEVKMSQNK